MTRQFESIDELNHFRADLLRHRDFLEKEGQIRIRLCMGSGCIASGSTAVHQEFVKELGSASIDGIQCNLVKTGCVGPCNGGPALFINDTFYERVSPRDVAELIQEHILNGKIVERLVHKKSDGTLALTEADIGFFSLQKKIVLRNCGQIDPEHIDDAIAAGGYQGLVRALKSLNSDRIIDEITQSGLRGRGGAGFPTGLKWQAVKTANAEMKYVVCNADEGDPGAFMDRCIMEGDPHRLIEGMIIAALAVEARRGFIFIRSDYRLAIQRLKHAINQATEWGLLGKQILGTDKEFVLEIRKGSGAFVCGEETALMRALESKRAEPRARPPYPRKRFLGKTNATE